MIGTIGLNIPLVKSNATFDLTTTTVDNTRAKLINLLLTEPGERIYFPTYGCGKQRWVFENLPANDDVVDMVFEDITNAVNYWLPEVNIIDITTTPDYEANSLSIQATFEIKNVPGKHSFNLNIAL